MTTACLLKMYCIVCQFVFSYFMKLGIIFATLKIHPATSLDSKQISNLKTK